MTVSYATSIRPLFRPKDLTCMARYGVKLDDYGYMSDPAGDDAYPDHAHARQVQCYLLPDACEPRMPMGGPYWTSAQLALFQQWMDDGFQP